MASFNIKVPNKFLPGVGQQNYATIKTNLANLKSSIGSIVTECSTMSNVPEELIYSFILGLSNGVNNTAYKTRDLNPATHGFDPLVRSGYFALSNKIAKIILAKEMIGKRMTATEKAYLRGQDPVIAEYISDTKGTKAYNEYWYSDFNVGLDRINDKINPINLLNPKTSIALGTIWIGQLWDKFSEQTLNPLDKVIVTLFLPYQGWAQNWNGGNNFMQYENWRDDFCNPKFKGRLPKPADKMASGNIINPNGGWVGESLNLIMGEGGTLWSLTS